MYKRYSYSALNVWKCNPDLFYVRYMSPNKYPRSETSDAMRMGSAIDIRVKMAMMEDLGMKPDGSTISTEDMIFCQPVWDFFTASGEYTALLDRFKKAQDNGGNVFFEKQVTRTIKSKYGDFSILGFIDFCWQDAFGEAYKILDMKCTNQFTNSKFSPIAPYNHCTYTTGKVKVHKSFIPHATEDDSWCGLSLSGCADRYKDQVYLYHYMMNVGVDQVKTDGIARAGIIQLTPDFISRSFGIVESDVMKDFMKMNKAVRSGMLWEGLNEKESLNKMELLEDETYRATMINPMKFY